MIWNLDQKLNKKEKRQKKKKKRQKNPTRTSWWLFMMSYPIFRVLPDWEPSADGIIITTDLSL